ncbi:MAG: type II toxin-antitoxin system VapC family toxin [Terriglobales bacterium]
MIALDTNLLVYAHRAETPEHERALTALHEARGAGIGWGIPLPVTAEFWSVVTGARAGARPATPAQAAIYLADLWREGAQLWFPVAAAENGMIEVARQLHVRGARIFDLQIALIARENGAREIWTHDVGFITVPGLRVRDPLA